MFFSANGAEAELGGGLDALGAFGAQYDGDELDGDDPLSPPPQQPKLQGVASRAMEDVMEESDAGQSSLDVEPDVEEGAFLCAHARILPNG